MGFIRKSGKLLGQTAGFVLGEPIKFVGKKLGSELIADIGDGVKKASMFAGDTVGQVAGGVYDTAAGLIGKDEQQKSQGLGEIGDAIGRTARGVVQTGKMPDGKVVEGVFPDFQEAYAAQLPESMYMESDAVHFHASNVQLAEQIQADPQLAEQFTAEQLAQIEAGQTPDGYTWHHSEVPGRMELVDEQIHAQTGHLGGRELWGGGAEHRG